MIRNQYNTRRTKIIPYYRPEEKQRVRIHIHEALSALEATLEAYRGMPKPFVITPPNGLYRFNTRRN